MVIPDNLERTFFIQFKQDHYGELACSISIFMFFQYAFLYGRSQNDCKLHVLEYSTSKLWILQQLDPPLRNVEDKNEVEVLFLVLLFVAIKKDWSVEFSALQRCPWVQLLVSRKRRNSCSVSRHHRQCSRVQSIALRVCRDRSHNSVSGFLDCSCSGVCLNSTNFPAFLTTAEAAAALDHSAFLSCKAFSEDSLEPAPSALLTILYP